MIALGARARNKSWVTYSLYHRKISINNLHDCLSKKYNCIRTKIKLHRQTFKQNVTYRKVYHKPNDIPPNVSLKRISHSSYLSLISYRIVFSSVVTIIGHDVIIRCKTHFIVVSFSCYTVFETCAGIRTKILNVHFYLIGLALKCCLECESISTFRNIYKH